MKIPEASVKLSIPRYYIDYWKKIGLISDSESSDLDFTDLLKIRFIDRCKKNKISLQKIRNILNKTDMFKERWYENLQISPGILLKKDNSFLMEPITEQLHFDYQYFGQEGNLLKLWGNKKESDEISRLEDLYVTGLEKGDTKNVSEVLKKILKIKKDHTGALIESGNIAFEENDLETALKFYGLAEDADKECVEAIYNIANIYFRQKKYAAAIRNFHRCIELDPDFPESYYNLGLVYYSLKYFDRAVLFLNMYIEIDSDSVWAEQAKVFINEMNEITDQIHDEDLLDL
ncbi:MAG: tetratricopeptide repeat protein [Spirochaetia bacterium]|nr:tetratricopeptide repeat protein [Spirochaetia bacterium]